MTVAGEQKEKRFCVGLIGATLDTDNMGVSALVESSVKCIINKWPGADICIFGSSSSEELTMRVMGEDVHIRTFPIRMSKNVFQSCHFCTLLLTSVLLKVFPWRALRKFFSSRNSCVKAILQTDLIVDVAAGDSFSDIYGLGRFIKRFLRRWVITLYGQKLVLLPQTYGPFKSSVSRLMARRVFKRASLICTRDRTGVDYVHELSGNCDASGRVRFVPDMAFVLDKRRPQRIDVGSLEQAQTDESVLVGLNVSGLLFSGGYTRNNMFGLRTDYRELVRNIIELLMKNERILVVLVPHVFSRGGPTLESDDPACREVYAAVKDKYTGRVFLADGKYNHNEIKYVIGMCDLFIGSRMHACIAALSQCIPAIGLAYSGKFHGVFESAGMEELVIDMRQKSSEEIINSIAGVLNRRENIAARLKESIPTVQEKVLDIFSGFEMP